MKINTLNFCLTTAVVILIFNSIMLGGVKTEGHGKTIIQKVDCFDRNGNKILGQTCEKEIQTISKRTRDLLLVLGNFTIICATLFFSLERE